jgi:hypothetical protein
VLIAVPGVALWLVHALLAVRGRRSGRWFLAWALGIPLMCAAEYAVLVGTPSPAADGADAGITLSPTVVTLLVGLALVTVLLVLEPALLLVDHLVRSHRERRAHRPLPPLAPESAGLASPRSMDG